MVGEVSGARFFPTLVLFVKMNSDDDELQMTSSEGLVTSNFLFCERFELVLLVADTELEL